MFFLYLKRITQIKARKIKQKESLFMDKCKNKKDKEKEYGDEHICTDPNGSYTGVPLDADEKPVQDVDDL